MQSIKVRSGLLSGLLLLSIANTRSQDVQWDNTPPQPSPIISMDQADYEPGETASFVGRGFEPFETVTLQVLHGDGREDNDADHLPWTVTANQDGEITSAWFVGEDSSNSMLQLTAVGNTSGRVATVTFSDGFITNGGFEKGLQGWSVVSGPAGTGNNWYVYKGTAAPLLGFPITAPPEGTSAVVSDHVAGGFQYLYQDLILDAGFSHTLSFKVYYRNRAGVFFTPLSLAPVGHNQQYRVDIIKIAAAIDSVAAADVLATPFQTKVNDPTDLAPKLISADLTPFAGSTVRLRFAVVETEQIFNGSVDDLQLVSAPLQCLSMQCPADISATAEPGQCSAVVNFAAPVPVSACPGVTAQVTCVPASGSKFSIGTTPVTCTAIDNNGKSVTCSFNVVVKDAEAPQISVSEALTIKCNPTPPDIAAAFGKATVTDNCSVGLVPSEVIQPEKGTGCTRTVTKFWSATDAAGNTGTASQTVTFTRDTENPVITLAPAASVGVNPSQAEIAAAFGASSVTDNCSTGLVATSVILPEEGAGCTRTVTKQWAVTDQCGNTGTASQTVTFTRDVENPIITLTPPTPLGFNPTDAEIAASFGSASVSDNCSSGLVATGVIQSEEGTGCARSVTKVWSVVDAAGNTGTAAQTVTFTRDVENPVITLAPATPLPFNPTDAQIAAAFGSASVSDNCSVGLAANGIIQPEQAAGCTHTVTKVWTATDEAGNPVTASQTVSFIRDTEKPRILSLSGPSAPIALGNAATITGSFVDDCSGVSCVTYDWNDGTVNTISDAPTPCATSHAYSKAGIYAVRIAVMDKCGNKGEDVVQFVVIYDASAGGVNGGGWIASKAGSYLANPSLTGKANFGFVAKYKAGASVPGGQTEFHFATLNFHSDAYEWLLVEDAGAQVKGSGSINGVSGYTFLLTITDDHCTGAKDKFRLKIWNAAGVVYDNVPGAPDEIAAANLQDIGQGSISIHR